MINKITQVFCVINVNKKVQFKETVLNFNKGANFFFWNGNNKLIKQIIKEEQLHYISFNSSEKSCLIFLRLLSNT